MKKQNYYEILEVSKDATMQEIKDSYKNLAKIYHPDNQITGNIDKMSMLNEAYTVLKDTKTKEEYDNSLNNGFSYNFFKDVNRFNNSDINIDTSELNKTNEEKLERIYNAFGRDKNFTETKVHSTKLKDVQIDFEINLEQAFTGYSSDVTVKLPNGEIRNLILDIPAGINDGDKILFEGQGNLSNSLTIKNSNLYIIVTVLAHETFQRNKQDIFATVEIDAIEAMLGVIRTISYLDESEVSISIPSGVQYGDIIKIQNLGMPKLNSTMKGNLLVSIIIKTNALNNSQKELLQNIKNTLA